MSAVAKPEPVPFTVPAGATEADRLAELLERRRFDVGKPPAKPIPRYLLKGKVVATPGNLLAIQAAVKAGKSAFVGALIASTMEPKGDCLEIESANPTGLAVVHFDTEQSPYDHHCCIERALRRAGRTEPPAWLRSYYMADVMIHDRRALLRFETERAALTHGGIHSILIDGIGDLCIDPNASDEAFALIDELHQLAIKFDCTVVPILHENPGSEVGKTRGHLGSQLERKAETNLRLIKDTNGVTTVFSEKARGAHIPRHEGVLFEFDEAKRMHVTVLSAAEGRSGAKLMGQIALVEEIFRDTIGGLSWKEIHDKISDLETITVSAARKRFDALLTAGLISRNSAGRYQQKARK